MSDSDSDIEILIAPLKPQTRLDKGKGRAAAVLLSDSDDDLSSLPDITRPKKKVDANKHAALSALLDAAIPASGSDSEGDSGIQILPSRNPSASSREASANTRTVTQRSEAEDTRSSKRDASTADLDINVGASTSKKAKAPSTSRDEKARAKALEKEEAERQKKATHRYKEDNKLAGSRKETLCEVVVEISEALAEDNYFSKKIQPKLLSKLRFEDPADEDQERAKPKPSSIKTFQLSSAKLADIKLIRWRRYTNKYWSEEQMCWLRYDDDKIHQQIEHSVLLFMRASELQELISEGKEALLELVTLVKSEGGFEGLEWQFFFLVEGINQLAKVEQSNANKDWQARVSGEAGPSKRKKTSAASSEDVEMQIARLEVVERTFTIRPTGVQETVNWLFEMSCDISNRPYKQLSQSYLYKLNIDNSDAQEGAKKGDHKSSYLAALQSMYILQVDNAKSIVKRYPTWRCLYEAYAHCANDTERANMLADLPKSRKGDGRSTDQLFGKALSKRVFLQLYTSDPNLPMDKIL